VRCKERTEWEHVRLTGDDRWRRLHDLLGTDALRARYGTDITVSAYADAAVRERWTRERMLEALAEHLAVERDAYRDAAVKTMESAAFPLIVVHPERP